MFIMLMRKNINIEMLVLIQAMIMDISLVYCGCHGTQI